ncbi:MAG: hypothetical protein JWQ96_1752 [Segetibacter sp.]|nr:hypothetical protein [Segetibacter sp.]
MNKRYSYLDSSRGIAALCVMLHHFIYFYGVYPGVSYTTGPLTYILSGSSAVTYFFVLSGFVLSIAFLNGQKQIDDLNFKNYLIQRLFRIFPLFLACLFISYLCFTYYRSSYVLDTIPSITPYARDLWQGKKPLTDVFKEAILVLRFPPKSKLRLVPQDWSLTIEIVMSLFIPVMILLLKRSTTWFLLFIGMIYYYDINVIPFAIGVLLARYRYSLKLFFTKSPAFLRASFALLALFFFTNGFAIFEAYLKAQRALPLLIMSLGAAMVLGIIINSHRLQKILSNRILSYLGRLSFGIYLTHFFILIFAIPYVFNALNSAGITGEIPTRLIAFACLFAATVAVSHVLYNVVEQPFIAVGKRVSAWLTNPIAGFSFMHTFPKALDASAELEKRLTIKAALYYFKKRAVLFVRLHLLEFVISIAFLASLFFSLD